MITKPVSKIFNVEGIDSTSGNVFDLSKLAKRHLAILDKDMKGANLSAAMDATKQYDIYYKDETGYVHKQPGSKHLMKSDIFNVNLKNIAAGEEFVAIIKDYKYCCDGEYGFRFVVHNDEMDKLFWPNGYYETYMVPIDECCAACGGTNTEDDNVITVGLYNAIKANEDSWLEPSIVVTEQGADNPTYTTGMVVESSDISAIETERGKTGLLIKIKNAEAWPYAQYNFKYTHIRSSKFEVGKIASAKCSVNVVSNTDKTFSISYTPLKKEETGVTLSASDNNATFTATTASDYAASGVLYIENKRYNYTKSSSTITVTGGAALAGSQDIYIYGSAVSVNRFELPQTSGYDLKQVEYQLMGYRENMSPYRLSDVTMTEFGYKYSFDDDTDYHVLTVSYEKQSDAATVHMPYPMSIVFAFSNTYATQKGNVATFFGVSDATKDANINLK